ncbi:RzlA (u-spanin) [Pectobacterium phage PPWS1]|uniref:RzlA (U-spanin) n=1 Tax=Pectobacterium phage PPWS1 TaxID=1685500 RepID=A0A0P0UWQ3_9CAUD|nr:Rz-like spanin [Pectobacterium phage PPWS1]BAS69566.1 RzlA (u-spanin) [Pectobacterium phage PPWS1]
MRTLLVLATVLALQGCAATSMLGTVASAVSPNKPELTAQVGAENTKQGVGLAVKQEDRTEIKDVQGPVNASKQGQQVQAGSVQAEAIRVTNGSPGALLGAFAIGMASVLGLVFWFVPPPLKRRKQDV